MWLLISFTSKMMALDPNNRITQYAHSAWRLQDGLFSGAPHAITQTKDGYVWIGTQNELLRFDGVRLSKWEPPAGAQLPQSRIWTLLASRDGSLWIGTDSGLAHWNKPELITFPKVDGHVNSMIERQNGEIWFSRVQRFDQSGGICKVLGERIKCYRKPDGIPLDTANALAEDTSGNLWFGDSSIVVRWNGSSLRAFSPPALKGNLSDGVTAIAGAPDGSVWLGFAIRGPGLGLQRVVNDVLTPFVTPELDSSTLIVNTLFFDRQNCLWIGTESQGIYRIHGRTVDHFGVSDGLSSNFVDAFYEDHEGDLWIATSGGIDCFRDLRVASFTGREGLPMEEVDSVLASRDGTVWAGGPENLVSIRGRHVSSIQSHKGLPGNQVTSLLEDHAGRLWVGVDNSLFIYEEGKFRIVTKQDGSQVGFVVGIAEDRNQNVWVETTGPRRCLVRISNLKVQEEFPEPQMPAARKLAVAQDGSLWLGLLSGDLARLKANELDIFRFKNSSTPSMESMVKEIFITSDGAVFGATSFGLIAWKNGTQRVLTTRNGLTCNAIYSLIADNQGTLWLYTQCGLVGIPNAELQKWWSEGDSSLQLYSVGAADGAQPAFVPFEGATKSPDGSLWFANYSGLQTINPANIRGNPIPPPVHIENVIADHRNYPASDTIALPANTIDLEIDYTALSFANPQKVAFRYKLEGRDKTWQGAGARRQAFYNDLPPGHYQFRVIASNNDGVWNERGAMLAFSIAPTWYQTRAFQAACVVLAALIVWLIYRLRVRYVAKSIAARFDERLAERTRIARDLHDTLLQTIQGSKLVADDALDMPSEPIRMRKALEQLSRWLQQAGQEGRAALNSLRGPVTSADDLSDALKRALEATPHDSLATTFSVHGNIRQLHPIVRDEVYRIGQEAIRNAHAHSGGTHLDVQLRYMDDLSLRIADDGPSATASNFSEDKEGHYGLKGMRERASRIGARLTIAGNAGCGTEVCVVVPGGIAFQDAGESRRSWLKTLLGTGKSRRRKS
ncbi:sensor histidine kinase [Occallatibacter riparius]|uniref:Histidine kinase n=1 Tax=Occallatibacter riparius TaxID=1002689 RepID=A0A9J7BRN4_9BACT|nr:two-component regulator propeller domain-containing protein [Occallatibacter riparius]UWZ85241.1 histidine kinase [Occallatibacter riparius]